MEDFFSVGDQELPVPDPMSLADVFCIISRNDKHNGHDAELQ